MDPVTLKTNGLETFGDLVTGKRTLAHMRHDHEEDALMTHFQCEMSALSTISFRR